MGARSTQADQHDPGQSQHTHTAPHTRNEPTENRLRVFTRIRMAIFFDAMLGNTHGRGIPSGGLVDTDLADGATRKRASQRPRHTKKMTSV